MSTNLDLKQTEKTSFKLATYADGTNDIALGLVMILLGIYPFTRAALGVTWNFLGYLLILGLIVFFQSRLRARLAPSRIGLVKFGPAVNKRLKLALVLTFTLLFLTALTWYFSAQGYFFPTPSWISEIGIDLFFAVAILGAFWAIAYTLALTRFYLYGVLLALSLPLQTLLPIYEGTPFLVSGGIITVLGAVLLARFLKQYPEIQEEV
jgi:hypothetical protein